MINFKIRLRSFLIVASISLLTLLPCGQILFAQSPIDVNNVAELKQAINAINNASSGTITLSINSSLTINETLPEIVVPPNVTVIISGGSNITLDGQNQYRGLVVSGEGALEINNVKFKDFLVPSDDGSGSDQQGYDPNLGGAIYVKGDATPSSVKVTLTNVTFNGDAIKLEDGTTVSGRNALGNDIFLNGSTIILKGNGSPDTVAGNISDITTAPNFDKKNIKEYAGGVEISGTDAITLSGNNTYSGVTTIDADATLIAEGGNAIGDLSEVQIKDNGGKLQLNKTETIGFLSGGDKGEVNLNGKNLIIAGNEDPVYFGKGYNPATGSAVEEFKGKIKTDGDSDTHEQLIKIGTGRLTLSGDNSNNTPSDEFTTTIYQGTIVLGHAKSLGGGDVTIKNIDTGTGNQLRNVLEAETSPLTILNNFNIVQKGKNIDDQTQNFNSFVVGGAQNIQIGNGTTGKGGQITGGNLLVNMKDVDTKLTLANTGHDGSSGQTAANLNNYNETQLNSGTLVVYGYDDFSDSSDNQTIQAGDTLGSGIIRVLEGSSSHSKLSAATEDMTIDNNVVIEFGSFLTLTNETTTPAISYTMSGSISGVGGLILDLNAATDKVTLSGNLSYKGATSLQKGTLNIAPANTNTNSTVLYNLSSTADGILKLSQGDLYVNITGNQTVTYSGKIELTDQDQTIYKIGSGTWEFDKNTSSIGTKSINVNQGALKLSDDDIITDLVLSGSGQLIVNNDVELTKLTASAGTRVNVEDGKKLTITTVGNTSGNLYNTFTGGANANIKFDADTVLNANNVNTWNGTMDVAANKTLTVKAAGALGNTTDSQVTLNDGSTLTIDSPSSSYVSSYGVEKIGTLNIAGMSSSSTLDVTSENTLLTDYITGSQALTKEGSGTWGLVGGSNNNSSPDDYSGDITLQAGTIYLGRYYDSTNGWQYDSDWGSGQLNVTDNAALVVDVDNAKSLSNTIDIASGKTLDVVVNDYSTSGTPGVLDITGVISGSGGLDKYGVGTLKFSAAETYTGNTNIYGGTLLVANTMASANVNIWRGAALEVSGSQNFGSGNINVNTGGTLYAAQNTSATTTTGSLNFASGSLLVANKDAAFTVTNVNIENGAVAYIKGTDTNGFSLFTTTNATNDMFWFMDDVVGKRATGTWDNKVLKITYENVNYTDNAYSANTRRLANYLNLVGDNRISYGGNPLYPVETATSLLLGAVENVNLNQYENALREIGGQINPSLAVAQLQTTTSTFQALMKELRPELNGFLTAESDTVYRGQSVRSGWTGWTHGLGIFGTTSGNNNRGTYGYDYNTLGVSVGIEPSAAMSHNRLGLFYAGNFTNIDTNQSIGDGDIQSHFVGAYGRFIDNVGYTSFIAGFAADKYSSDRSVTLTSPSSVGGTSNSDFHGWEGGLYLERGLRRHAWGRWGIQPYAGLQYLHLGTDGFNETGSNPYRLLANSSDMNSLRTNFGLRFVRALGNRGKAGLSANVSWMHEFLDANYQMTSKLGTSGNPVRFTTLGNSLGRDWVLAGAGLHWNVRQNIALFGSYDLQINGYETLNVASVGAGLSW
ncbi:MAG: autotransporter domain-containing protein [Planctomycetaceae bacterium]|jgi:autotransporter-associated beta strand protein|nr:autotransporter domain-containing protein [Planctomycetaceae bacterium]